MILDNLYTDKERKNAILKMIDDGDISQLRQIYKYRKYRTLIKEISVENCVTSINRKPTEWTSGVKTLAIADLILFLIILINS